MLRRIGLMPSWRILAIGVPLFACACLTWPGQSYGEPRAHHDSKPHGAAHLYVLLGLLNMSPGLSDFGSKIGRRGIPTTVSNYSEWPALAQNAITQYKRGRLSTIMIVGHSLGGSAAMAMAAELGRAGVPVQLVATLDATGEPVASSNVRRSVIIRPKDGEDHFSVIAAHDRDLSRYVLGGKVPRGSRTAARRRDNSAQQPNSPYTRESIN